MVRVLSGEFTVSLASILLLAACSDGALIDNNKTAPTPGPSAAGWISDFQQGSAALSCDDLPGDFLASEAARVEVGESTVYVGYEQVGQNQNPIVARFDGEELIYCLAHEEEGPDGRAEAITWNGGDIAYVVYTVVGGGTSFEGMGGWLGSYAPGPISGGGPKVSYLGKVDITNGELLSGTFIIAVKSDNTVNSHSPEGPATVLENGNIEFLGASAHKPIDADGKNAMECTDYPFSSRYVLSPDLDALVCAECTNCQSQLPCE